MKNRSELNISAYQFVDMLHEKQVERHQNKVKPNIKGLGMAQDLGSNILINSEETRAPFTDELLTKYVSVNEVMIGLGEKEFPKFKRFLKDLYEAEEISGKCSFNTLINYAFTWITTVYANRRSHTEITDYIFDRIEEDTNHYKFLFRVQGLGIEDSFEIGNTVFKFYSHEEVEQLHEEFRKIKPNSTLKEFKEMLRNQFDHIIAEVNVRSEKDKAAELALDEVQLSIDVVKCFCYVYAIRRDVRMFELDFRYQSNGLATYLQMINGDIKETQLIMKNKKGVLPIEITNFFLQNAMKFGMGDFAHFISHKKDNQLYYRIIDLIRQFSVALSSHDHYDIVSKCISLFESLCVPENSTKAKGFTYFKKIITTIYQDETQQKSYFNVGLNHYKIRDKYIHNNIRWPMDSNEFMEFLDFIRIYIHVAIQLSAKYKTVEEFQAHFGIK